MPPLLSKLPLPLLLLHQKSKPKFLSEHLELLPPFLLSLSLSSLPPWTLPLLLLFGQLNLRLEYLKPE